LLFKKKRGEQTTPFRILISLRGLLHHNVIK
jgi:hypothetical protein